MVHAPRQTRADTQVRPYIDRNAVDIVFINKPVMLPFQLPSYQVACGTDE